MATRRTRQSKTSTLPESPDEVANATSVLCERPDCGLTFVPKHPRARFCSTACRSRAARDRKAAEAAVESDAKTDSGSEDHELVRAVRRDLQKAGALDSVNGQVALQLARRVVEVDAKGVSALTKELRAVLAEATASASDPTPATPTPEADKLDDIGRRRAEKEQRAREAAG